MATCCGADRATAFCPDCGKRLKGRRKPLAHDAPAVRLMRALDKISDAAREAEAARDDMAKARRANGA